MKTLASYIGQFFIQNAKSCNQSFHFIEYLFSYCKHFCYRRIGLFLKYCSLYPLSWKRLEFQKFFVPKPYGRAWNSSLFKYLKKFGCLYRWNSKLFQTIPNFFHGNEKTFPNLFHGGVQKISGIAHCSPYLAIVSGSVYIGMFTFVYVSLHFHQ